MTTSTRVRGIPGLIAALPLVVGNDPDPGILLLLEDASGIAATLRWEADLPVAEPAVFHETREAEALAARSAILIGYRCEPGVADLRTLRTCIGAVLEVHHAITVTDEHWWVDECTRGCCDGALRARPSIDAALGCGGAEAPGAERCDGGLARAITMPGPGADVTHDYVAAWQRLSAVAAQSPTRERVARADDLVTVLAALADAGSRDVLLEQIAPELLYRSSVCALPGTAPMSSLQPMSSEQMEGWRRLVPDASRGLWDAVSSVALWREGRDAAAAARAKRCRAGEGASLAGLVCAIVRAGFTYDAAVAQASGQARGEGGGLRVRNSPWVGELP